MSGLQKVTLPDGSIMVDLQGRFQEAMVVQIDANGKARHDLHPQREGDAVPPAGLSGSARGAIDEDHDRELARGLLLLATIAVFTAATSNAANIVIVNNNAAGRRLQ
jgi:hypothetical protein